jgi:hypothetical protein
MDDGVTYLENKGAREGRDTSKGEMKNCPPHNVHSINACRILTHRCSSRS